MCRRAIKPTISLLIHEVTVALVYSFNAHSTGELLLRIMVDLVVHNYNKTNIMMVEHASICVIELLPSADDSGYESTY